MPAKTIIKKTQGSDEYQNIYCGLEDKKGNLWFGSSGEGVYRYDGKSFRQFVLKDGLTSNTICCMLEDRSGNIWIGTKSGLCCFDGTHVRAIDLGSNAQLLNNSISTYRSNTCFSIMQDRKGKLWFGTAEGVYCYDRQMFTRFLDTHTIVNDSSLSLKSVQCLFEDNSGNIWFGSGPMAFEGLCMYNGKSLVKVPLPNENWIRRIAEGQNGNLLLITRRLGVISFNGKSFSSIPSPAKLRNDLLTYMYEDRHGHAWFASDYVNDDDITTGGLWEFDGRSFKEFTKNDGLSNTSVAFVLEDKHNNIWIGTRNTGLYRYDGKTILSFSE